MKAKHIIVSCGGIILIIMAMVAIFFWFALSGPEGGVRLANSMEGYALGHLAENGILEDGEELVAYYDATISLTGDEAAILTSTRIVYFIDGRIDSIALSEIEDINHRSETFIGETFMIVAIDGRTMQIIVAPFNDGETFRMALFRLWERAKASNAERVEMSDVEVIATLVPEVTAEDGLDYFLPFEGEVLCEAFLAGGTPEMEAIGLKMKLAIMEDPEWLQAYIKEKNAEPGELLPWHPKMGITRAEYEEVFENLDKMGLIKVADLFMRVEREGGNVSIILDTTVLPFTEFKIDKAADSVRTELATLSEKSEIDNDDHSSITGRWKGVQWKHEWFENVRNGFSEKLAFGRMKDSPKGIVYYDLKSSAHGETHFLILYDLN